MTQTAIKERGIPFSTDMVKAILERRKMQTRQVIKPQPEGAEYWTPYNFPSQAFYPNTVTANPKMLKCPYGQAGDRLWVEETWRIESFMEGEPLLFGYKDGQRIEENEYSDTPTYESWYERIVLQSIEDAKKAFSKGIIRQDDDGYTYRWKIGKSPCRWRSPRLMPRWASRILLEITEVRIERLQEISEADAEAEGFGCKADSKLYCIGFRGYWDSINAHREVDLLTNLKTVYHFSWRANPWVWVIGLEVCNK